MRPIFPAFLCLSLLFCAQQPPRAAPAPAKLPAKSSLRALIVSGGPTPSYNQYAIESNARYLEKLTARAASQRILFADGSKISRTISALEARPDARERAVFAWIFETDDDSQRESQRAATLGRIDGPSTRQSVVQQVQKLAGDSKPGSRALLYFTGHGSAGQKPRAALFGPRTQDDYENTTYALWNGDDFSTRDLGAALANWPAQVPLVLVMVQCHAGGFANLVFQGGDPKNPVWNRDFCGFFASTGERQASGCTSQVDETDYQDFTTHFFAALSGISRGGQAVRGADYDANGAVSLLEAFAWTNLQDNSIDVPVCTSDAYLRSVFPQNSVENWQKVPYSQLLESAAPWQKAMLNGLSKVVGLSGEARIEAALAAHSRVAARAQREESVWPASVDRRATENRVSALQSALKAQFSGLNSPRRSPAFAKAKALALKWLAARPAEVEPLHRALKAWEAAQETDAAREAMLWRFVRAARTVVLQKRLAVEGTAAQKATFARLRASESRNPLL
jgi:hypothetical protein